MVVLQIKQATRYTLFQMPVALDSFRNDVLFHNIPSLHHTYGRDGNLTFCKLSKYNCKLYAEQLLFAIFIVVVSNISFYSNFHSQKYTCQHSHFSQDLDRSMVQNCNPCSIPSCSIPMVLTPFKKSLKKNAAQRGKA